MRNFQRYCVEYDLAWVFRVDCRSLVTIAEHSDFSIGALQVDEILDPSQLLLDQSIYLFAIAVEQGMYLHFQIHP